MKKLLVLLLALPLVVLAAEVKPDQVEVFYKAGEFNVSLSGGVTTPDFTAERLSVGTAASYFLTKNIGVEVEGFAGDTDGVFVDQAAAQLVYRIPVGQSAPYLFAGAFYNFEDRTSGTTSGFSRQGETTPPPKKTSRDDENWGVSVGVGIEHRFSKGFGVFTDARLEKYIESGDPQARARAGVRLSF